MPSPADAPAAYAMLALTVAISLYQFNAPEAFTRRWALSTAGVFERGEHSRIISHAFLHGGGAHLFVNMVTLFFFGPPMEWILGPDGFLALYFGSLVAAAAVSLALHRRDRIYMALGASGAISGLVFAYVLFRPTENFYLFFIPIGVPAFLFAPLYLLYSVVAMGGRGRIAHEAHIGGAAAGLVLAALMRPGAVGGFFRQLGL